ncbi:hypothetical protein RD110_18925 [Rhodoferax koreense]|uniref:DNA 3'-5' helicase n=1 Tax=Rhodoferax koreensis TaxID=1842727 RepID=A0A1P8JZ60_9BURK|nr:ATP-dependent helicase [Rhodoferax koreense]APW39025.1 hypothetical protein RD110_18925 [Rhodoferax koreense]
MNLPAGHASAKTIAHFVPKAIVPTAEQLAIQISPARMAIVEANAGASKTTVLALRMAEAWTRHTHPDNILALTYTEAASTALKAALRKLGVAAAVVAQFRIATFEDFCTEVLAEIEGGAVPVYTEAEQLSPFIWQAVDWVAEHPGARWRSELLMPTLGDHGMTDAFLQQAEVLKGTMADLLQREEQTVSPDYAASIGVEYTQLRIFLAFEKIRRANPEKPAFRSRQDATYDLACMIHAGEALRHHARWPRTARVIVVDEMHDMNQAMFTVLQALLASNRAFFCGVGDIDQVIHKAAGADARFMRTELAAQNTHNTVFYPLTHSFRFSATLAGLAGRIAGKPYASMASHDTEVAVVRYQHTADCAQQVVQAAQAWKARPKAKMAEFAVLLRHAHQSVEIENALIEAGIPYTTQGFDSYVMRPEVLFVRGLLAVAADDLSSVAVEATRREVMRALMFFSASRIQVEGRERESQQDLLDDAIRSVTDNPLFLTSFFENQILRNAEPATRQRLAAAVQVARSHSGPGLLQALLAALQIQALVNNVLVSHQRRIEAAANLAWLARAAERFASPTQFFQHLNAAEQKQRESKNAKAASLVLASIASVKGLEFDCVSLPYLAQGEFPAPHADAQEELNTLYVGITRARRFLTLHASAERPSEFMGRIEKKAPGKKAP